LVGMVRMVPEVKTSIAKAERTHGKSFIKLREMMIEKSLLDM